MEPVANKTAEYPPIGDYALIGDCRTAALIGKSGSVDWLCLPGFDSPSVFAALLDRKRGGHFLLAPTAAARVTRRYVGRSNVLETTFYADDGVLRVTDCMPVHAAAEREDRVEPARELLRRVEVLEGEPELLVDYQPRPDYARMQAAVEQRGRLGWFCEFRGSCMLLRSDLPLRKTGHGVGSRLRLKAGARHFFSVAYSHTDVAVIPALGEAAETRIEETLAYWEQWAGQCRYDGPYQDAVMRSILTLKLLDYSLSGAVLAAPTASLPEWIGADRNWDYRYCWLRDAGFTLRAFMDLGYFAEGESFFGWLLHTTRLTWPELQVLYTLVGEVKVPEQELDHLEGYRGSRPVRIGNGAYGQLQLDVYGEVVLAAHDYVARGGALDYYEVRLLRGLGESIVRLWQEPDRSIWEVRGPKRHYTYSKLMAWTTLDCLVRLQQWGYRRLPAERFRQVQGQIREAIEARAWNPEVGSYVGAFESDIPDASLLLMAHCGFHDAHHPRMVGTFRYLQRRLQRGGLFYRYAAGFDGFSAPEGAFGICTFWASSFLALQGDVPGARALFERGLECANDLGLLSEEVDPDSCELLGNFPQAFSHGGMIDAALHLDRAERRLEKGQNPVAGAGE